MKFNGDSRTSSAPASTASPAAAARPFPPPGLTYFFVLNDDCRRDEYRRQIRAFADAGISALILHPRDGLLVPYGGTDWFDLIKDLVNDCLEVGIEPILYDEDPYPSGSASGRITAEHPELAAQSIERFEAPGDLTDGELFIFPTGKLLWAGAIPAGANLNSRGESIDLTDRVGMLRRTWEASPWDSRWYYPATPLYSCPRAMAYVTEYGLRRPAHLPAGSKLVAFVARRSPPGQWDGYADSLNPAATKLYIEHTHERYAQSLGEMLGREVRAIFTDEAKPYGQRPWTPGIFESFEQRFGYDLRPRLEDLFDDSSKGDPRAMLTRIHYRQWVADRFIDAWLRPVSQWCEKHGLALIGHLSPEDDPVQQVTTIGNVLPIQQHLSLSGIDLIIPAVGDARHPILNVGVTCATSSVQQLDRIGVMSETLGASGIDLATSEAAKILAWQTLSGVSMVVVHAAFASTLGLRKIDAPPDFGPNSSRWRGMCDISVGLEPFRQIVTNSMQDAPVAILWPARAFMAETTGWWQADDSGPRRDLLQLLLACLQAHVGVHVIDEPQLASAELRDGRLCIGRASYATLLLPTTSVLAEETVRQIASLRREGFRVHVLGDAPKWAESRRALERIDPSQLPPRVETSDWTRWCRENLPQLLKLRGDRPDELRVSAWRDAGEVATWLVMNLGEAAQKIAVAQSSWDLAPGQLIAIRLENDNAWRIVHSFESSKVTPNAPPTARPIALTNWRVRWPEDTSWRRVDRPKAAYQLNPKCDVPDQVINFGLTGVAWPDGKPVAAHLDYAATIRCDETPRERVELVLEPTAQRGRFTISLNGREWNTTLRDTDASAIVIDLSDALKSGDNELQLRVEEPMSLDGIKWEPIVRLVPLPGTPGRG